MQLLGRETELATTDDAVEQAAAGAGRALGVFGEAGIGKSALMGAVRERAAAAGMLVLEGRAAEHERSVPFGLAVDALDDHVATLHPRRVQSVGPDLAAVLPAAAVAHAEAPAVPAPGAAERFRYHRAVRSLLELLGRERPVALLLDDLHWADEASVELVLHLLRRPPRAPHLLAFALRPQDPAARVLDAARSAPAFAHLAPGPLPDAAAHALVAAIPDAALRERVVHEAGGNPLFLEELRRVARDPAEALPPTLMAAVGLEIAALPDDSRALIEGAAVAGDPFDPDLAAAAAHAEPAGANLTAALDRLVAADLVRPTGHGRTFAFRHPLVRRAVYDAAPPGWRLEAHERTAGALAARGAGPAVRAHHVARYARQGDLEAVDLLAAAAAAVRDSAPATAARRYATALALLPDEDTERRAALLGPMALAQGAAGRLEEARDTLDAVLRLLPGEPTTYRIRLIGAAANLEAMMGRGSDVRRRVLAALEVTPPERSAGLQLTLALTAYTTVDLEAMRAAAALALEHAGDDEPTIRAAAEATGGLATVLLGEPEAGRAAMGRAVALLAAVDDTVLASRIDDAWLVAVGCLLVEDPAAGLPVATRAIDVARATSQDRVIPMLAGIRAMLHEHHLRLDEALQDAETATDAARLFGDPGQLHQAVMNRANILHLRGERTEAAQAREECLELVGGLEPSTLTVTTRCNVASQLAEEDPARCISEMTDAGGPLLERVDRSWSTYLLATIVHAAIGLGRLDDARRWAAAIDERAALTRLPGGLARAAGARAELLLAGGDGAEAARIATDAAERADAAGMRLDALFARLLAGRALAAAGARRDAVAMLQRVAADAGRGNVGLVLDAAGRELRRLGTRVSASSRRAAAPTDTTLSEREQAIADLVAEGRTNKQVAATLFLAEKTVEHHLSRIYVKLGVRSRVELASRLAR
jgi:ATP/maltotriose-dependent transcriptional regulator MalT